MKVRSPDGDTEYFDIVAGVLQGDTLALYFFIICLDYVLRISIDKIRENGFELTKKRSKRYPAKTITDADYALLANTPNQAETLLHSLERAAAGIGLHVNAHKTEYMCYNQTGNITTLDGASLMLVDKFTYLGSSVSSTENDIDTRLTKAWTAIDRLSIIWKSDLTDEMKRSFFQAVVVSILLYGCTTWTLTKRLEKKLDGNYTRMLRAILNKSWRQHTTRRQLYGHLPAITKTIQVRRARHARHCWRSKDELVSDVLLYTHLLIHSASQQHNIKDRRMKENAGRLLYKYSPLTLLQGFERNVQGLHVRGCWRPNINFTFWPHCYDRHVVSFLFSWYWDPLHRGFPRDPSVVCGFPYHISSLTLCNSTGNCSDTQLNSII